VTIIDRYKYEIDEQNTVRIWDIEVVNENNEPFLLQPYYPNSIPWESKEAAENWAINYINELLNPVLEVTETTETE
jgi:hypothetical protein